MYQQSDVSDMMMKLGATSLYREFMDSIYALIDSRPILSWRRKLLSLREQYAPRFFAKGIDCWICSERTGGKDGHNEYWVLFVDRAAYTTPPSCVKKSIDWRHLLWGMGTGLKQREMAPIIDQYLMQLAD